MAKQNDPQKQQLFRDMDAFVRQLLGATPVVRIADLEEKVHEKFAERIAATKLDLPLSSGRVEWGNLVDWVKAHLTKQRCIKYFIRQKEKYLAFLPSCGQVDGITLVKATDAARLRDALIDLAAE